MVFKCLQCNHPIIYAHNKPIQCKNCNKIYFSVNGTPLLLEHELQYLNDNYASITTHISNTKTYIQNAEDSFYLRPNRLPYFRQLQDAYDANLEAYAPLIKELEPYTNPELIAKANYAAFASDPIKGKEINYFIRDWSGLPECEMEVGTITALLKKCINDYSSEKEVIFFAGSGTGRFAYELSDDFEAVYCTDLSFRMVKFFDFILKGEQFNLNILSGFSNVYDPKDVTKPVNVKAPNADKKTNIANFISDIRTIPLLNDSVDVFSSIYFLDVLNIEYYVDEINRVLKTGGIYVNIGPIGYHGSNYVHNLLPSEIKTVFEEAGFTIEFEELIENPYMNFEHEMSTIIHKNWVLVARKNSKDERIILTAESVLKMNQTVFTERRAELSNGGENVFYNRLYYAGGNTYEDADLFIEILYRIDGTNTLATVIALINEELGVQLSYEELEPHIERFIENKTLSIIN